MSTRTYMHPDATGIPVNVEIERGGPALWHAFASKGDATVSHGPFKTRKAALRWAFNWGGVECEFSDAHRGD